jgi:WD40 repeat protein
MADIRIQKLHTLTGHRDCVYTIASGPLPNVFFSAAGDGMVVQWDLLHPEEGERIAQLPNSIYALQYVRDRDVLIAGHNYQGIHLLDWSTKKEIASLKMGAAPIFDIQVLDNNCFVASGDGSVTVVDLETMSVRKRLAFSQKNARAVALHSGRGEMAVGYSDHFIRVFRLEDFTLQQEWLAHSNSVFTLAYTPDGKSLFSGSRDAHLKVWSADNGYELYREIIAHLYSIHHMTFSPDGKHFVTCSMDKSVKVWRTDDMILLKVIDKARHAGHGTSVNKLLWTSFKNQLISASDDRTLSIWDVIF